MEEEEKFTVNMCIVPNNILCEVRNTKIVIEPRLGINCCNPNELLIS